MANLVVVKGANPGTSIPLEGEKIVMGRNAECGIVINLPEMRLYDFTVKDGPEVFALATDLTEVFVVSVLERDQNG